MKIKRGDVIPRPNPWILLAASSAAAGGWEELKRHAKPSLDRAYMAITSDPRRTDERQYQLKGSLGAVKHEGATLDQWQFKVTGAGRIWYAIDDQARTLWLTHAANQHPRETES